MSAMKLVGGLDIGNGYVKGSIMGSSMVQIDIPSCVVHHEIVGDDIKKVSEREIVEEVNNIFNTMDVSFESPLVPDKRRCLVGGRCIMSGRTPEEFDVHAVKQKAKQPLTATLSLACVAGKALQDYCQKNGKLPDKPIDVEVTAAMALPITEFRTHHKTYAAGYMDNNHAVIFHNFANDIRVNIKFVNVPVTAEGASAQYGIASKGKDLVAAMLQDIRSRGVALEGYEPEHIVNATSILGIDIGEGTVNFPVFINGQFNTDVSMTLNKGYGEVMDRAVENLRDMNFGFRSRKDLTEFLNNPTINTSSPIYQKKYVPVQKVVDAEIVGFVDEIVVQFNKIMARVSTQLEVIYVYGGGATPVQRELYPQLIEKTKSFGGGEVLNPILYLDSRYSRYLNREGLFAMAERVAKGKKE